MVRPGWVWVATALGLAGCVTPGGGPGAGRRVDVVAHRGASAYAPENTMAAFRLAAEQGADWIELDCGLTRDGRVVVIHDSTLDRTTDGSGPVAAQDLATLKTLDAGSWKGPEFAGERLPELGEALDFARGRMGVYIEVKPMTDDTELAARILEQCTGHGVWDDGLQAKVMALIDGSGTPNAVLARRVLAEVRARRMEDSVVLQSFSPVVCAVVRAEAPEMRGELLGSDNVRDRLVWENALRWGYLVGVTGFNMHQDALTEGRVAAFRAAGRYVAAWTVDEPERMRALAGAGVTALITNRPDVAREVLQSMGLSGR